MTFSSIKSYQWVDMIKHGECIYVLRLTVGKSKMHHFCVGRIEFGC